MRCLAASAGTEIALGPVCLSSERISRRSNIVNSSFVLRFLGGGGWMGARTTESGMPNRRVVEAAVEAAGWGTVPMMPPELGKADG